jgi:hypothetical protein
MTNRARFGLLSGARDGALLSVGDAGAVEPSSAMN